MTLRACALLHKAKFFYFFRTDGGACPGLCCSRRGATPLRLALCLPLACGAPPHLPIPLHGAAFPRRSCSVSRSPPGPHPTSPSPFTAPPSLVARPSLLSPGDATPLQLACAVSSSTSEAKASSSRDTPVSILVSGSPHIPATRSAPASS